MKVIKSDNGIVTECDYPRDDMLPVVGLDKSIQYYILKKGEKPDFNPDYESLKRSEPVLTDEPVPDYPHFKYAIKN
jgi:hypothetical protein